MAKIIDPDMLNQGTEIDFDIDNKVITLNNEGNLDDGISLSALYSFCMEQWRTDDVLIREQFPLLSVTNENFQTMNGWNIDQNSINHLRDGSIIDGDSLYCNITSMGYFHQDQSIYYQNDEGHFVKRYIIRHSLK